MITIDSLQAWMAAGWAILPCHSIRNGSCSCGSDDCASQGKHPRLFNGVKGASKNLEVVTGWAQQWPDANWAVATGAPSGIIVADLDRKSSDGFKSFDDLLTELRVSKPDTFEVRSGSGGRHVFFAWNGAPIRNRVNLRPGLDVRADGGYVLLPGSNHISGGTYEVENRDRLAYLPDQLARLLNSGSSMSAIADLSTDDILEGVDEGSRDEVMFAAACRWRRQLKNNRAAVTTLVLAAAAACTPPFPEDEALKKVSQAFAQDHSDAIDFDVDRLPFVAVKGSLPDFLADADPDIVREVEKGVRRAEVQDLVQRVRREKRVAKYGDAAALDGDEFMFGEVAVDVPIWGDGDTLLWAEGGGLMIPSDQGLGKSLTAQQIVASRLGVGPGELLGQSIHRLGSEKIVVYLALDRPRQIARSMARLFRSEVERSVARERLRIWTKPIPIDILGDTYAFADWVQETFGTNVGDLVIDSVKDLTPANLSHGEVGQSLDMAWKECRARGMNTLILHHERKTGNEESRANRMPSLDHIYGSVWLTSGMDSILHIQGKQGENLVRYTHLKAIVDMLDPIDAVHDQENGRTDVLTLANSVNATEQKIEQVFAVISLATVGGAVVTPADVVEKTGIAKASVDRYIKALRDAGRIEQASPYDKASGTPATYRVT